MAEQNAPARAVIDALRQAVETTTAQTVFGEPITRGEVTVVPVTRVRGGGGGGGGTAPNEGTGEGSGGGLMVHAKPVGAYVIKDGRVCWRPCVDVNRLALGGQLLAMIALLTARAIVRSRH